MTTSSDSCGLDSCLPPGSSTSFLAVSFSLLPLILSFSAVSFVAHQKLFPLVSELQTSKDSDDVYIPSDAPIQLRQKHAEYAAKSPRRRVVAGCFAGTIGLAAVLAELILCEISNMLNPEARALALGVVIPTLLFQLVVSIPFLELQSLSGCSIRRKEKGMPNTAWVIQGVAFMLWLSAFWWLGKGLPGTYIHKMAEQPGKSWAEACLERVGIIGISLMALLSGFAAVSTPWQTFGVKQRPVTESDIARKQAGLDATNEMLAAKKSRLRGLQRKLSEAPRQGLVTKVIGTIRGSADAQEIKSLELEISGLTSMELSLSSSLVLLQNQLTTAKRSASPAGKMFFTPISYALSCYCIYRIVTTTLTSLRRQLSTSAFTTSSSDPINRILSLLAKHIYPTLDQASWSRQISFLLSGLILLASFNSVLQTFHMLTKLVPSLLYQAQANLALLIAQISATYVISSALLLRSNLPSEMKSVVSEALGSPLEPGFVERWFDGWFLLASVCTGLGIWIGRKFSGAGDWDDWDMEHDVELGQKMS